MEPLSAILKRLLRLLPFLTMLTSYRRSYHELFYPDVWSASESAGRGRSSDRTLGRYARPYLGWNDQHDAGSSRREPFW